MTTVIVGGGLSGLSTAYYLLKTGLARSCNIKILEASSRVGGWVKTVEDDGTIFETGPRSVRPVGLSGFNTLDLIEELGLAPKIVPVPSSHAASRNRLIYTDKKLVRLPFEPSSLFVSKPPFGQPLLFSLARDLLLRRKVCEDDSMYEFAKRRFGIRIADYLVDPLARGVCAGNSREISAKFLLKQMFEGEQNYGSALLGVLRAKRPEMSMGYLAKESKNQHWSIWSLQGGLQVLPDTLLRYLQNAGVEVIHARCDSLHFTDTGATVTYSGKSTIAEQVISAIPAFSLSELVKEQHPHLSDSLSSIPYVTVGVVSLEYSSDDYHPDSFGFLVPSCEPLPILGVVFDTCSFPQEDDKTVLSVMIGGAWYNGETEDELLHIALSQVKDVLGIKKPPKKSNVSLLKNCLPQYVVGHYNNITKIRNYVANHNLPLKLVGASYDGVSVNDVIYSAKTQVDS